MKHCKYIFPFFLIGLISLVIISCNSKKKTEVANQKPAKQPNIIFFIADDMLPEMFNCLPQGKGKNLTPNVDRLATEGTIFTNQYVVSPVCTPSRFNCLTGRYASRATNQGFVNTTKKNDGQTVIQWNTFITVNDKILPAYLKQAGYKTGMVGKNHVIEAKGFQQFPDFNADPKETEVRRIIKDNYKVAQEAILNSGFDYAGGIYHNNPYGLGLDPLAVHNLDWMAQAGIDFIEQNHTQPFFLYFASTIPHGPGAPERSWNADPTLTATGYLDKAPEVMPARQTLLERVGQAGLADTRRENLLWLDDALGALVRKLEEHDVLQNTIIFFFNDHGQHAKGTLYQGGTLNPSIIWKSGGFSCGNICEAKITNVDFVPTILDLAGADYSREMFDGQSFKNVLDGAETTSRESLYFELGFGRAVIKGKYKYYALRYPEYAVNWTDEERAEALENYNQRRIAHNRNIVNTDPKKPFSHIMLVPGGGDAEHRSYGKKAAYFDPDQLYDLEADPDEMVNLAKDPVLQNVLIEMREELQRYLDDLPGNFEL